MSLFQISKSNRKWPKIDETKIVWKNAYMWLSESQVKRENNTPRGAPKEAFFLSYFDSFLLSNAKCCTIKAFADISLVLLNFRARNLI